MLYFIAVECHEVTRSATNLRGICASSIVGDNTTFNIWFLSHAELCNFAQFYFGAIEIFYSGNMINNIMFFITRILSMFCQM